MEDNIIPEANGQCIQCRQKPILEGYPMQLCADCRNAFNKFPIPKWIWAFCGFILLLMLSSFVRMPKFLDAAIHLRRAEKAIADHRYVTAGKEADKVLAKFPDLIEANSYRLISTVHGPNIEDADAYYYKIKDVPIENKTLLADINTAADFKAQFIPDDTLLTVKAYNFQGNPVNYLDSLADYTINDKAIFGYILANKVYDSKEYAICKMVLEKAQSVVPDHYLVRSMMISVKRETADYNGALSDCEALLTENKEDIRAMSYKCKIYFSQKKDQEALALATQAMALNPLDIHALEALAVADHYTGKTAETHQLLKKIKAIENETGDTVITAKLTQLLQGTDTYR